MKLLFQVMCGQNYLWITADLVQEGFSEYMCFTPVAGTHTTCTQRAGGLDLRQHTRSHVPDKR
eukprot:COSAG01_NODE_73233_length_250_cov_3.562914_1_plen_62_part_01